MRVCVYVCVKERERERERESELLVKINNSLYLDAHCVCSVLFAQRLEPQGRRFRNFCHYYFPGADSRKSRMETDNDAEFKTR